MVNNGVTVPEDARTFNSYNQPSLNVDAAGRVPRAQQGRPGGEPAHGVFMRDMAAGTDVSTILDRTTDVPQPNNLDSTFIEPPSFPRIDMWSDTVATRGNHQPVWNYDVGTDPETGSRSRPAPGPPASTRTRSAA